MTGRFWDRPVASWPRLQALAVSGPLVAGGAVLMAWGWIIHVGRPTVWRGLGAYVVGLAGAGAFALGVAFGLGWFLARRPGLVLPPHKHAVADTHLRLEVEGERMRRRRATVNRALVALGAALGILIAALALGVPQHGAGLWLYNVVGVGGVVAVAVLVVRHVWRHVQAWREGEAP